MRWHKWCEAFSDINFAFAEIIAEGNTVVTIRHVTGTHRGEYSGRAATGNKVAVGGVSIDQIENGVVVSGFDA